MEKKLRLYNTKTRQVEEFVPIKNEDVGIYSCGPTVYHYAHLGNLRAYIFADTLRRTLLASSYRVKHLINITDVGHLTDDGDDGEDKLEKGSRREGRSAWDVAHFYEDAFKKDLDLLNIPLSAYGFPRATDHIQEQIALIENLEQKGFTYLIEGDGVYFDTKKFDHYGDLAQLDIEHLRSGARVEENIHKRNLTDFALWKFSKEGEQRQMEWESPWGKGFPGWHIECSAMSMKYLGNHFDIHTGGIDHIPVHHTNEIAQSECATGETYVNYWMHVNFLQDKTGKMSKSHDDFLTLEKVIEKGYDPLVYRYFVLTAHYRKELTFTYEALEGSKVAYKKLKEIVLRNKDRAGTALPLYVTMAHDALLDDVNTPEAIATIWKMLKDSSTKEEHAAATIIAISKMLGLGLENVKEDKILIPQKVEDLLEKRLLAKKEKNYALSDELRDEIKKLGFIVKDTGEGQEVVKV